jgi:hypothetical protein
MTLTRYHGLPKAKDENLPLNCTPMSTIATILKSWPEFPELFAAFSLCF